jgi:hypothetical protein
VAQFPDQKRANRCFEYTSWLALAINAQRHANRPAMRVLLTLLLVDIDRFKMHHNQYWQVAGGETHAAAHLQQRWPKMPRPDGALLHLQALASDNCCPPKETAV